MSDRIELRYLDTAVGRLHLACAGPDEGVPVFLLHQTPRSWDEYREVLAPLGRHRRVVAIDTLGYGASDPPAPGHTIEAYAAGVLAVADALGAGRFDLVGHHTGGVVAIEVAASASERVERLVLSSTPYVDADARAARQARPHTLDAYTPRDDGGHLLELWNGRASFYPAGRAELLDRCLLDTLRADDPAAGHRAIGTYRMEERLPLISARVLCVGHEQDPHAMPSLAPLASALGAEIATIAEGYVPLEHTAERFVEVVAGFLTEAT